MFQGFKDCLTAFITNLQEFMEFKEVFRKKYVLLGTYKTKDNKILRSDASNLNKKEILAQMFPCEFCEISKNTFFKEHLRATASGNCLWERLRKVSRGLFIVCKFKETFILIGDNAGFFLF